MHKVYKTLIKFSLLQIYLEIGTYAIFTLEIWSDTYDIVGFAPLQLLQFSK